ncbi:MAG: tetratricopeptide repeat protein [Bacteroidota bacterium]
MTRPALRQEPSGREGTLRVLVTGWGLLLTGLVLAGMIFPSPLNWGFHSLAFLPLWLQVLLPLLMGAAWLPGVQTRLGAGFRMPLAPSVLRGLRAVLLIGGGMALFWGLRQATFFLGDGFVTTRALAGVETASDIHRNFAHAPVPGFIAWQTHRALHALTGETFTHPAFQAVSIASGGIGLVLLWSLARACSTEERDRAGVFFFLLGGGCIQLFFGYVETYPLTYAALLLFLLLALAQLEDRVHPLFPAASYALLLGCHFGAAWFLPAQGFLLVDAFRRGGMRRALGAALGGGGVFALILLLLGYPFPEAAAVFAGAREAHLLPLFRVENHWQSYPLLSWAHLADLANLAVLVSPWAVPVLLAPGGGAWKSTRHPGILFLGIASASGAGFAALLGFRLGMSRDWDAAGLFLFPLTVLAAFLWQKGGGNPLLRRSLMGAMAATAIVPAAGWVFLNASEEGAARRQEILIDERLWSGGAVAFALEDLSGFYRDRGEYDRTLAYLLRSLSYDSTNARRWANAGGMYVRLDSADRAVEALLKALRWGSTLPEVYVTLGTLLLERGRYDEGVEVLKNGLAVHPALPWAAYNIGSILGRVQGRHREALEYLDRAIRQTPRFPMAYYQAGRSCEHLGEEGMMRAYYGEFLRLAPSHPLAPEVRKRLGAGP